MSIKPLEKCNLIKKRNLRQIVPSRIRWIVTVWDNRLFFDLSQTENSIGNLFKSQLLSEPLLITMSWSALDSIVDHIIHWALGIHWLLAHYIQSSQSAQSNKNVAGNIGCSPFERRLIDIVAVDRYTNKRTINFKILWQLLSSHWDDENNQLKHMFSLETSRSECTQTTTPILLDISVWIVAWNAIWIYDDYGSEIFVIRFQVCILHDFLSLYLTTTSWFSICSICKVVKSIERMRAIEFSGSNFSS